MKLIKKTKVMCGLFLIILIVGCGDEGMNQEPFARRNHTVVDMSQLNIETNFVEIFPQLGSGNGSCSEIRGAVALGIREVHNPGLIDYEPESGFMQINLETPQDIITISGINFCYIDRPFLLKVFYNYEEIPFRIVGVEEYDTGFVFELEAGHDINIPIQLYEGLEVNDYLNVLTIGLFPEPGHHAMNDDGWTINNMFGSMWNFAVSYGGNEEIDLGITSYVTPTQLEIELGGLNINQDEEEYIMGHGGVFNMPGEFLQVTSGEVVELHFHFNTHLFVSEFGMTEYLLMSMLNWQQIDMNGQPYLLFEARPESSFYVTDRGTFTIVAPEEAGFYEFKTFIVPNPTSIHDELHMWEIIFSFPFTLEVVE